MLTEIISEESSQVVASHGLRNRIKVTKRVESPKLAPSARNVASAKKSGVMAALDKYRQAQRAETKARAALKKLVDQHPGLGDIRPAIQAGIRNGEPVFVRCRADFQELFGSIEMCSELWRKFDQALTDARPSHKVARRRAGICRADNVVYKAARARFAAFERLVLQEPQTRGEMRAYAKQVVLEMERTAGGTISNTYYASDPTEKREWKDRRHYAMLLALRVLNRLAK